VLTTNINILFSTAPVLLNTWRHYDNNRLATGDAVKR